MQENKLFDREKYIKKYYKNISLTPLMLNQETIQELKQATEGVANILNKTKKIFITDKKVRDFFGFNSKQLEIINSSDENLRLKLGRFDGFITKKNEFKFLELNTNFPGGINRLEIIDERIKSIVSSDEIYKTGNLKNDFMKMVKGIKDNYSEDRLLVIAYGSEVNEIEINSIRSLSKMLDKEIGQVKFCHWKELNIKGNKLLLGSEEVGVIFRAVLLNRVWEYDYDLTNPIFKLLAAKKIMMFNGTYDYLGSTKDIFALWHEEFFDKYLDDDDRKIIEKFIPWTKILNKSSYRNDRENYILKPKAGYGGHGVVIGKNVSREEWNNVCDKHKESDEYIIQEYIEPTEKNVRVIDTQTNLIKDNVGVKINVSPWCVDGKMSYVSGRYSESDIINVKQGGGIISILRK